MTPIETIEAIKTIRHHCFRCTTNKPTLRSLEHILNQVEAHARDQLHPPAPPQPVPESFRSVYAINRSTNKLSRVGWCGNDLYNALLHDDLVRESLSTDTPLHICPPELAPADGETWLVETHRGIEPVTIHTLKDKLSYYYAIGHDDCLDVSNITRYITRLT